MDLQDGQSVEVKGSGAKPYVIKNTAGVYDCTCPAWRNQNATIDRRTCKHIKKLRGDAAEAARIGGAELPGSGGASPLADDVPSDKPVVAPPELLLAESWDGVQDPTGWWMSEKLDGVRAYWDGEKMISRLGNKFYAPERFLYHFRHVKEPLDGELWMGRRMFQKTVSLVRRMKDEWQDVYYLVFDAPKAKGTFEERRARLQELFGLYFYSSDTVFQVAQTPCEGIKHLKEYLASIEKGGGEGVMLRQPGSKYEYGRSHTLLKVKNFKDQEATVIGHYDGRGKHKGRLGALEVQLANGTKFRIGTGFSDAERENPPPVGSVVTFRYQELTTAGVPRFPAYVGRRIDVVVSKGDTEAGPGLQQVDPAAADEVRSRVE